MAHYEMLTQTAMDPHETTNCSACPLLALPAELRVYIYELALTADGPLDVNDERINAKQPALTHTNRQIRIEALPVSYGKNTFGIARYGDKSLRSGWLRATVPYLPLLQALVFTCKYHQHMTMLRQERTGMSWSGIENNTACALALGRCHRHMEMVAQETELFNQRGKKLKVGFLKFVFGLLCK